MKDGHGLRALRKSREEVQGERMGGRQKERQGGRSDKRALRKGREEELEGRAGRKESKESH